MPNFRRKASVMEEEQKNLNKTVTLTSAHRPKMNKTL